MKIKLLFSIIIPLMAAAQTMPAAVVFSQTFTGSNATLVGSTSTTGNGTWSGADFLRQDGATSNLAGGSLGIAYTPVGGYIYDLSATINLTAANGSWLGLGFLPNLSGYSWTTASPNNTPLALNTATTWQIWGPTAAANHTRVSDNILIRLDTTAAQWTVATFQNNVQIGSTVAYAPSSNPAVTYVGFVSEAGATGAVSAFQLTVVPEPTSLALLGLGGLVGLAAMKRRKAY